MLFQLCLTSYLAWYAAGKLEGGYLGRIVAYYKKILLDDMKNLPHINFRVSFAPASAEYQDDKSWDQSAALRLLAFLRSSPGTPAPLRRMAFDLTMQNRRFYSTYQESFAMFPSLSKNIGNFYYDIVEVPPTVLYIDSSSENTEAPLTDSDIIIISNPVEARLPSAKISVKLLKEILEARAQAVREMPTTKRKPFTWPFTKSNSTTSAAGNSTGNTAGTEDGTGGTGTTPAGGATGGTEAAGTGAADATTAVPAAPA